ncbi:MAG TPA: response regulator transcription factor [Tepidiformaceae bacterium]|nr:response regulator transcription factor [Tepidiformaceae bacterium]
MSDPIHVLLADDHDLVRSGLRSALRGQEDFSVVGEAGDGEEAVREAVRTRPDLVVMDVRMPRLGGIEACREIRSALPDTNVLMLTSYADEQAVMASIVAGASGFMLKGVKTADLIEAMRVVGRGGKTLDPASSAAVIEQIRRGNVVSEEDRVAQQLSERELRILDLIADGMTNREIGEQLYLSEKTVKHHVSDILGKLGLTRRVEAAGFAIRRASKRPPD